MANYSAHDDSSAGHMEYREDIALRQSDPSADNPGLDYEGLIVIVDRIDTMDGGKATGTEQWTCYCGCGEVVNKGSKYRQGHDARAKGALIRAGRAGVEVSLVDGGGIITGDARTMVSHFASTDGFVVKVLAGIDRPAKVKGLGRNKGGLTEKGEAMVAAVSNSTKAKVAEATGEPTTVKAKVGRWVKEGTIRNGDFVYNDAKGAPQRASKGKYTVID